MKRLASRPKRGFTLIEIMIVVAIVGTLAAIAIPNYLKFQLRARSAEAKSNLAAIRTAQEGSFSERGTYVQANPLLPRALAALNGAKFPWAVPAPGFDQIGWEPEGEVYFSYQVIAGPAACAGGCTHYTAEAVSDLDADGTYGWWGYVRPDVAGATMPGSNCVASGVYNAVTSLQDQLSTVGPCAAGMGGRIF